MFSVGTQWNPLQTQLRELLLKEESFPDAMALLKQMHGIVHEKEVSGQTGFTLMDEIWQNLSDAAFRTMPTKKDVTVAWDIWHITRIEDLTSNLLINDGNQVLNADWQSRLNTSVTDTGNAMTDEEIISFSNDVAMDALREYRSAVGRRTREMIEGFSFADLKRKFSKKQAGRILMEGGVTEHKDSVWLLDFWGRKNVAGILLMPTTRHQMGHLNDCLKLKAKCAKLAPGAEGGKAV